MSSYSGPERRQNVLYVTQNTEYHLQRGHCIGVRDLWSGRWRTDHPAVGRSLFGAVLPGQNGLQPLDVPKVNCLLWFENGETDILTSRLTAITRPSKSAVAQYAH